MIENIITLILNTKARQISKYVEENKELRQILYDICEGCLRGEVLFQDQRVCYDCPIEKFLTRGEENK
jgi:hypothetical protein|nr:MAG TPA: hypothetical protein [Caudoviricetes sp.]